MKHAEALAIAKAVMAELEPHCERIMIAGSIRRGYHYVKDIEIVAIPKPYEIGLFATGVASVVGQWKIIKGKPGPNCKSIQAMLPQGIKLDLFFARPENWGYILAIRTGSKKFSHKVLGYTWCKMGYKGVDGDLTYNGKPVAVREESDLFNLLRLPYTAPEKRD